MLRNRWYVAALLLASCSSSHAGAPADLSGGDDLAVEDLAARAPEDMASAQDLEPDLAPDMVSSPDLAPAVPQGAFGAWLEHWGINPVFTLQGAVIASTLAAFPLVHKAARAAFESVDPQL